MSSLPHHSLTVYPYLPLPKVSSRYGELCSEIAIIGGGRWAKVLCKVVRQINPYVRKIYLVSPRNTQELRAWASEEQADSDVYIEIEEQLEAILQNEYIHLTIVANAPVDHYEATEKLLKAGKNVLVEKPWVPSVDQAHTLLTLAEQQKVVLAVGHEFMMASYLYYYRHLMEQHSFKTVRAELNWHDVFQEQRWESKKLPDFTTDVVNDLYPHILSQLGVLFGEQPIGLKELILSGGGASAVLELTYGSIEARVSLSRTASSPERSIQLKATDGRIFHLDYSQEPGTVSLNGDPFPGDPLWGNVPRPLAAELLLFHQTVFQAVNDIPILARHALPIVEATVHAEQEVVAAQKKLLTDYLIQPNTQTFSQDSLVALRTHLVHTLLTAGLVKHPKDEAQLNHWTRSALQIMHRMANAPFTAQEDLLHTLDLDKVQLERLNRVLRATDLVQGLITQAGTGRKYWQNTIIPLVQSGAVDHALAGTYCYPHRIGVYPGVSCMFHCTFCGRHPTAKYDHHSVSSGNEYFKSLFEEAPKDDPYRFYISGGLEPLTNPGIGEVVEHGRAHGFKLSMYTNGFMLTPQLLQKQPGLWDLDVLRISFYGVDAETTFQITQKQNAYDQVIKNVTEFLKLRNERQSLLKLGFNFVILPGKVEQILEVAEALAAINGAVGPGQRQIDFLTLRENYSVSAEEGISPQERNQLIDVFQQFERRIQQEDLCQLQVDYGYSLFALQQGTVGTPLKMVDHEGMRRTAYPQVSVVTDLYGDVYAYREAGFLDRPGADRYIMGRASVETPMSEVVRRFVEQGLEFENLPGDTAYFDIFDHVVTSLLSTIERNRQQGLIGPVCDLIYNPMRLGQLEQLMVAHPTLAHPNFTTR